MKRTTLDQFLAATIPTREINIGGFDFSKTPVVFKTLLGSCVSVCLHHPQTKFGGMNHILLPGHGDSTRYGMAAMEYLISEFVKQGIPRTELKAKVFGGGHQSRFNETEKIGLRNLEFVKDYLKEEKISILASDTGGDCYRIIAFESNTFRIHMKRRALKKQSDFVFQKEIEISEHGMVKPKHNVTFF